MATPLWMGKMYAEKLENAKLEVIKEARHSPQFTHSQQTVNLIESFI